jgi:hypothetical protein
MHNYGLCPPMSIRRAEQIMNKTIFGQAKCKNVKLVGSQRFLPQRIVD